MFVNADGGLTTAGYVLFIVLAVIALLAASVIAGKVSKKGKMSAKQIAFCSMAIALAYVTSYIKLFSLPFSGSVTLCSMRYVPALDLSSDHHPRNILLRGLPE